MRVLNLYAGIGGNRKLWPEDVEVTAVELNAEIADVYMEQYPQDNVCVDDAHDFLLHFHQEFDFIWSSPPCQSHTKMIRSGRNRKPRYPDMKLYEEILLLQHDFKGKWVVENVVPYYTPLIHAEKRGRHLFWANFYLPEFNPPEFKQDFINMTNLAGKKALMDWLGIHFEKNIYYEGNHCPAQVLRNAVHPEIGKIIWEAAYPAQGGRDE
jgi:DNA (cytosine-5)-methyltransferase 1